MKRSFTNYQGWSRERLIERIQELEKDNGMVINLGHGKSVEQPHKQKKRKIRNQRAIDFSRYQSRLIGLKFAYLGWDYQGLALQGLPTEMPTVEEMIIKALQQVRLVQSSNPPDFEFSRCGRTDKGVSAMNQVISLRVRSKLSAEELKDPANDAKELDYIKMLNHVLPPDIRFHAVCLRPPAEFNARFSCLWRQYKYIFSGEGLNITKMKQAAQYLVGVHDFRNFCKIDGSKQLQNFMREIYEVNIEELKEEPGYYVMNLKGSAFLWHQVRYMMAVLFTVGQDLEKPEIVPRLLDIKQYPTRPAYKLAHDIPLILYDCGYDPVTVKWSSGPHRQYVTHLGLNGLVNDYKMKSCVVEFMHNVVEDSMPEQLDKIIVKIGDGMGQVITKFIPYSKRQRVESVEVTNQKWRARKDRQQKRLKMEEAGR